MSDTYREYYKLSGRSFVIAEAFHDEREEALKHWFAFTDKKGAIGSRPDGAGCMRSLLFAGESVPKNWRKIGRHEGGVECVPRRTSKAGKKIAEEMKSLPRVHDYIRAIERISRDVAKASQVKSGNRIMWATAQRLSYPETIYLASIPRALDDGLKIPDDWIEMTEREYTLAYHEHNSEVDRMNLEIDNAA